MPASAEESEEGSSPSSIPIFSNIVELHPAPRRFLFFNFLNVISWQCIAGPFLVLFARHIDMPASWVGFLISFMPLSMLLVVATPNLVIRLGAQRLLRATWGMRNLAACSVFVMPWAIAHWGPRAGWLVLMASTLGFCVVRAFGVGGWYPWLHEIVPEHQRGTYFSAEASVTQVVNVMILVAQAFVISGTPTLNRFLAINAFGVVAGFASLILLSRIPGGQGADNAPTLRESLLTYRKTLREWPFIRFVLIAGLCYSATSWLSSSFVLYLRDVLSLSPETIMLFMAAGSIGTVVTIGSWGRFTHHSGSGRAMFKSLTAYSLGALLCLVMRPDAVWTPYVVAIVALVMTVFGAAFATAAGRALLTYMTPASRVGHTNAWHVTTALALGVTPILVGYIVHDLGLWGFRLCFAVSGLLGLACAIACRRYVGGDAPLNESILQVITPVAPIRVLARIMWITLGLHESNRR